MESWTQNLQSTPLGEKLFFSCFTFSLFSFHLVIIDFLSNVKIFKKKSTIYLLYWIWFHRISIFNLIIYIFFYIEINFIISDSRFAYKSQTYEKNENTQHYITFNTTQILRILDMSYLYLRPKVSVEYRKGWMKWRMVLQKTLLNAEGKALLFFQDLKVIFHRDCGQSSGDLWVRPKSTRMFIALYLYIM